MEQEKLQPDTNSFERINEVPEELPEGREPLATELFIQQMKETADKLIRDRASRGDVKLLNTALKELRYSFKVFAAYRHCRKVSVFGSARLPLEDPACQMAIALGRRMVEEGFMVITGAASGIMEAGHIGAGRENSIGVNILLPFEQQANPIIANDAKLMHLKYFFTRKLLFIKESDGIILFPGGFGTLDEGFEALTLVQTGKSHLVPIVMVDVPGSDYWQRWQAYVREVLLARKLISQADLALFKVTDSVEAAVAEVVGFFRVYHSMRYVGKDLVLRLKNPISPALVAKINSDFRDILKSGSFELTDALPQESGDTLVKALPRLRFHYDRHGQGRLRMLIDLINKEGG